MREKWRKYFEVVLLLFILAFSVAIFLLRDKLTEVGKVGYLGLFLLCVLANSTVLLPSPSLMVAASCALVMDPLLVALVASIGSSVGELVGYAFGTASQDCSPKFHLLLEKLNAKIHNDTLLVFILAVLPLPLFDVIGIYSGGTKMNLLKFFAACFAGKFLKMLVYTNLFGLLDLAGTLLHR